VNESESAGMVGRYCLASNLGLTILENLLRSC
jgi:hypothetical protein